MATPKQVSAPTESTATEPTSGGVYSIVPVDDLVEHHTFSADCPCHPTVEKFPNGDIVIVHNAIDGRA